MPYITPPRREAYALLEQEIKSTRLDTPGEMVYLFCRIADMYMCQHPIGFKTMNDVVGAFENAKKEFQDKVMRGYEDDRERENGSVWKLWGNE